MACPEICEDPLEEAENNGCTKTIDASCVIYTGDALSCANISENATVEEALESINTEICEIKEDVGDFHNFVCNDLESCTLANLGNVTNTSLSSNQYLTYNGTTWVNTNIPTPFTCSDLNACSFDNLGNVSVSSAVSGQTVIYNGTTWIPSGFPASYVFTCDELESCTLNDLGNASVSAAVSGDVLFFNGTNWINTPFISYFSASNGLTKTGSNTKLGGILTEDTTINTDSNYLLLDKNITSTVNTSSFPLLLENHIITGGTESTKTVKACTVASLKVDLTSNLTVSTDNNKHGAFSGTVYKDTIRNWVGKLPVYFAEQEHASTGNTTWAISYLAAPPSQYGGQTTFTGTITNAAGLYINDISGSNITARITNKYGIYQEGTSDKNVFYGEIEYHGALTNASDVRSKNKGNLFTKGLEEIEQIVPVFFTKKEGFGDTSINHVGIIAQEIEEFLPEAIKIGIVKEIEDFRLFDQSVLIYTLINAVKELSQKVKTLELK